jgi:phosphatidylglycerophosphate synthase
MGCSWPSVTPASDAAPAVDLTAGERWTRDALGALRADRYRPRAWVEFLAASFERGAETRAARPALAAQVDRWLTAWLVLAAVTRLRPFSGGLPPVPARRELAWAASVHSMLRWHLGMVEGARGERRERLSAADALSLVRVWTAPRLARADRKPRTFVALVALCVAGDVLDGALARRHGPTRLGRDLDTLADACAATCACTAALRAGWIERHAALALAARYGLGLGEALWRYFARCERPTRDPRGPARALGGAPVAALAAGAAGHPRLASRLVAATSVAAAAFRPRD